MAYFRRLLTIADQSVAYTRPYARYKGRRESLNVDSAGIGYYFGRHLSNLGYPVNLVNVGEATAFPAKFANLKAQLTGRCMSALRRAKSRA